MERFRETKNLGATVKGEKRMRIEDGGGGEKKTKKEREREREGGGGREGDRQAEGVKWSYTIILPF